MGEYQNMITKIYKKESAHILPSQNYKGHSENKTFHLHDSFWRQEVGAAVGGHPISAYAIICIAEID